MTAAKALVSEWNRMGSQMRFFVGTLAGIPDALMHYRGELLRVIAQMGLGGLPARGTEHNERNGQSHP